MNTDEIIYLISQLSEKYYSYKQIYTILNLEEKITWKGFSRRIDKYPKLKETLKTKIINKDAKLTSPTIIGVTSKLETTITNSNLYQTLLNKFSKDEHISNLRENQVIKLNSDKVAIVHLSCPHFGSNNLTLLFEHTKIIQETPNMYLSVIGDMTDCNIADWTLKLNLDRTITEEQEYEISAEWLTSLKNKLLLFIEGNHDLRRKEKSGISLYKQLLKEFSCLYDQYQINTKIVVGEYSTNWSFRHHYNGNTPKNPFKGSKDYIINNPEIEFTVSGHIHNGSLINQFIHYNKLRTCLLVNTYKQVDEYGRELGLSGVHKEPILISLMDAKNKVVTTTNNIYFAKDWLKGN